MLGLRFEEQPAVVVSVPERADIACFVGFVARRAGAPVPAGVRAWLVGQGWAEPQHRRPPSPELRAAAVRDPAAIALALRDRPGPLFDLLRAAAAAEAPLLLAGLDATLRRPELLSRPLASVLNGLLDEPELHDQALFAGDELPPATAALLATSARGETLRAHNRLLLEAIFGAALGDDRPEPLDELLDLPAPVDSWQSFDELFAWEQRDVDGRGAVAATYLGAAVRSFFAQGGRKCYVVRVGDPWLLTARRERRLRRLARLLPGHPGPLELDPGERATWRGAGHLFGLRDVAFLALPDLAEIAAADPAPLEPLPEPAGAELFVECDLRPAPPPLDRVSWRVAAPRCDEAGYAIWARAASAAAGLLARRCREAQLVAGVPLPAAGTAAERNLLGFLAGPGGPLARGPESGERDALATAFLQLGYPWLRTRGSARLAEGLEGPEGALCGVLARSALLRGAFRSAAGLALAEGAAPAPALGDAQLLALAGGRSLPERVSVIAQQPGGVQLLSDVTASLDEAYRPAAVSRLVALVVRAARRLGEDIVFEPSGTGLWSRLRESLGALLEGLLRAGALRGETPERAFEVRCDRSTMTQSDLDSGRVVAQVRLNPAAPIEGITVALALSEGGELSVR